MSGIKESCLAYGAELGRYSERFGPDAYKRDAVPALREEMDEDTVCIELAGMHPAQGYPDNCKVLLINEASREIAYDANFGVTEEIDPSDLKHPEKKSAFQEQARRVVNEHFDEIKGSDLKFDWFIYGK